MGKRIRQIVMAVLLIVFVGSFGIVLVSARQYQKNDQLYSQASEEFTSREPVRNTEGAAGDKEEPDRELETAPITVDFDKLQEVNSHIVGWIYCEGTVIDYPVVQGEDNDFYLHHSYDGEKSVAGSIFVDANNRPGFVDSNMIIYGHHMKNKAMFATLSYWADQDYYREHPVMWLLTPEQDYKIVLFSGYTTIANSDTYTIFSGPGEDLDEYLKQCQEKSDFTADAVPSGQEKYVVLSTCAYAFDNARNVLQGILLPVDSAGGRAL